MQYTVVGDTLKDINLAPETEVEEILQNVAIIITTSKFSVPLNRDLGLSQRFIDMPLPVAKAILISEIHDAIEKYEPRASIGEITFKGDELNGKLVPIVEVIINNN